MKYSINDKRTQKQLNLQLEQQNIFTKIDISNIDLDSQDENLPALTNTAWDICKKALNFIKELLIKFFKD